MCWFSFHVILQSASFFATHHVPKMEEAVILRHFRPRPGFLPKADAHEWRRKDGRGGGGEERQRRDSYSSVTYDRDGNALRLTYRHVQQADGSTAATRVCFFLSFEVVIDSRSTMCVLCSGPNAVISTRFRQEHIDPICGRLTDTDVPSLFSVVSQLLNELNQLPLCATPNNEVTMEPMHSLVSRVAKLESAQPTASVRRMLDFQTLLLRCAAAGRNRSKICSPIPAEFVLDAQDGDLLARRVFSATNQIYSEAFRRGEVQKEENQHAWTMLTFLLSLPWTKGGSLSSDNANSNAKTVNTILDISSALGDETPEFARYAKEFGTVHAYHGTTIDKTWSILNYGLRNLSYDNALSENGAMMGAGVYLSTAFEVARMFAQTATRSTKALAFAFHHESLLRLLHSTKVDVASLGPLDEYNISCLPVFEAIIIAPPADDNEEQPTAIDQTSNIDTKKCTRQEGKYFVAESDLIRISKLHLRFDLAKKSDVWSWLPSFPPLYAIVICIAILWLVVSDE